MRKGILIVVFLAAVLAISGCRHGDFEASVVFEGQAAPHAGYNIGPDTYVMKGQPCKVGGLVIWVKGLDPNDLLGEQ